MRLKGVLKGLVAVVGAVMFLWLGSLPTQAQGISNYLPLLSKGDALFCRFGVNNEPGNFPINPLRIGWFIDYRAAANPNSSGSMEYFPMIRLEQIGEDGYDYSIFGESRIETSPTQLNQVIDSHPGAYWFIGNEPDRIQFQDDMEPRAYARAYHDLYYRIKARDPSAKIVAGSIVQATPLRLEYLDAVLLNYFDLYRETMPVDVWAFHNFILNEANCNYYAQFYPNDPVGLSNVCWGAEIPPGIDAVDGLRIDVQRNDDIELFKEQVVAFRTWVAERGYRNKPVFLSEYGILMPGGGRFNPDFDPARVNAFMNASFDFLLNTTDPEIGYPGDDNRLVQRFSWYSVDNNRDFNGFLFNPDVENRAESRTLMGDNFAAYTSQVMKEIDFSPMSIEVQGGPPLISQGVTTLTLQANIYNSGNLEDPKMATVRFYDGDPNAGGTQIGGTQSVDLAGCGESAAVTVTWPNVTPDDYTVYVQVATEMDEVDTTNNIMSESVKFQASRLNIPAIVEPTVPQ